MDEARSVGLGNDPGIGIRFDESERLGVKRLKTMGQNSQEAFTNVSS